MHVLFACKNIKSDKPRFLRGKMILNQMELNIKVEKVFLLKIIFFSGKSLQVGQILNSFFISI